MLRMPSYIVSFGHVFHLIQIVVSVGLTEQKNFFYIQRINPSPTFSLNKLQTRYNLVKSNDELSKVSIQTKGKD